MKAMFSKVLMGIMFATVLGATPSFGVAQIPKWAPSETTCTDFLNFPDDGTTGTINRFCGGQIQAIGCPLIGGNNPTPPFGNQPCWDAFNACWDHVTQVCES